MILEFDPFYFRSYFTIESRNRTQGGRERHGGGRGECDGKEVGN